MRQCFVSQALEGKIQGSLADSTDSESYNNALFTTHAIKLPPPPLREGGGGGTGELTES